MHDETKSPDYEVGFGKPPAATRFRKGRSGNPKGRPKGKPNAATVILRALAAKVVINENGRRREVTKQEAAIMQVANKAAGGDLKAIHLLISLAQMAEERVHQEDSKKTLFGDADQLVLEGLIERLDATTKGDDNGDSNSERQTD